METEEMSEVSIERSSVQGSGCFLEDKHQVDTWTEQKTG